MRICRKGENCWTSWDVMKLWINKGKYPRWVHWFYAQAHGYWWLPCSGCGKMMGSHEPEVDWLYTGMSGTTVCLDCEEAAKANNEVKKHIMPKYADYPSGKLHW